MNPRAQSCRSRSEDHNSGARTCTLEGDGLAWLTAKEQISSIAVVILNLYSDMGNKFLQVAAVWYDVHQEIVVSVRLKEKKEKRNI